MAFIPKYILILFLTISIDYVSGIIIEQSQGEKRKLFLLLSLTANIGVLAVFKYFNFFSTNLSSLASFLGWNYPLPLLSWMLPLGLSFHTFQSMSYTIEIFRGAQKAERHLGILALYVLFYPQLVAGPIERPQNMLPQFHTTHTFDYQRVSDGLKLMAWGLFKKVVIADRLAMLVNHVYAEPRTFNSVSLVIATVCFSYQIYCDFSGYSDIALGTAQVMGFKLMKNFDRPYSARSISEFWRRWHISLSTWFRDYLYIPLGGNRVTYWRYYFNFFIVFLLSGLWHGASWNFAIWGLLHWSYIALSTLVHDIRKKLIIPGKPQFGDWSLALVNRTQVLVTFSLVSFAWIFFRAANLSDATYIARHVFDAIPFTLANWSNLSVWKQVISSLGMAGSDWLIVITAICILEYVQIVQTRDNFGIFPRPKNIWLRWSMYYALILAILFFGVFNISQFIYFQF